MLRIWGKLWLKNRIYKSETVTDDHRDWSLQERTKVCVEELTRRMDLATPLYFKVNLVDLEQFGQTSFTQDHFIETFPYQRLEIEIIGTDDDEEAPLGDSSTSERSSVSGRSR